MKKTYVLFTLPLVACFTNADPKNTSYVGGDTDWETGVHHPGDGSGSGNSDLDDPLSGEEVCDGWDNDADGQIDENTDGGPCQLPNGSVGLTSCINGRVLCSECRPGDTKTGDCGCGIDRADVCNDVGVWALGACDSCETPPTFECTECTPGALKYQRCDTCIGNDCGSTCVGASFQCTNDCRWQQITSCSAMQPQCDRDVIAFAACGQCGVRRTVCDGCFQVGEDCKDQGSCMPGDRTVAPCFDAACAEGWGVTLACNEQCEWEQQGSCQGCEVGTSGTSEVSCLIGYPGCGSQTIQFTCEASTTPICEGEDSIIIGQMQSEVVAGSCSNLDCIPGQTEACVMPDGRAGRRSTGCTDSCEVGTPGPCEAIAGSCPPGEIQTTESSCGCGAVTTITQTCRADGSGWSTTSVDSSACPECLSGERDLTGCTTSAGECGYITLTCTDDCEWPDPSTVTCEARSTACTPGATQTQQISCGSAACGATFTRTTTCRSDGCGWSSSDDRSTCPQCNNGDEQTTSTQCIPGVPECGYVRVECNSNCEWVEIPCAPCG